LTCSVSPGVTATVAVSRPPSPPAALVRRTPRPAAPDTSKVASVTPSGTVHVCAARTGPNVQMVSRPDDEPLGAADATPGSASAAQDGRAEREAGSGGWDAVHEDLELRAMWPVG
jgi:hypothetical protein